MKLRRRTFTAGALSSLVAGCSDPPAAVPQEGTTTGTPPQPPPDVSFRADLPPLQPDVGEPPGRVDPPEPEIRVDVGEPVRPEPEPEPEPRPVNIENLLFLSIDDLNDYVGFMGGHPQALTPNLDQFAASSVAFMNAHCSAPSCNPSRTSVMTGLRPTTTGIYRNENPWFPVLGDTPTIPSVFRDFGFRTLGAGKLFHGNAMQPLSWDDYFPAFCDARPSEPGPSILPANGIEGSGRMDWGPLEEDAPMGDAQVAAWIQEQFAKHDGMPTMFGCGLFRPHLPWFAPLSYFDALHEDTLAPPPFLETDWDDIPPAASEVFRYFGDHERIVGAGAWKEAIHGYLATIAFADAMFGQVIDALDASPLAENTAVVVWSDHGWHLGEKLHWRKFSLWEEATRVPLMVRLPGVRPRQSFEPVSLLDIFPTLAEIFDLPGLEYLEGTSLMPLIRDPKAQRSHGAVTTWDAGNHSVRTTRLRYTRYYDGSRELYDHTRDPHEWTNVADDPLYADSVALLDAQLPDGAPAAPITDDYLPEELGCEVPETDD